MCGQVKGEVHHDRRLHQLMLQEEQKVWDRSRGVKPLLPPLGDDDDPGVGLGEPLLSAASSLSSSGPHPQASSSLADSASSIYSDFVDATHEAYQFRCRPPLLTCRWMDCKGLGPGFSDLFVYPFLRAASCVPYGLGPGFSDLFVYPFLRAASCVPYSGS